MGFAFAWSAAAIDARLITRGGEPSTRRYPWIVEAALKSRNQQFVIAGEGRRGDFLNSPGRVRGSPAGLIEPFPIPQSPQPVGLRAGRCRAHLRF